MTINFYLPEEGKKVLNSTNLFFFLVKEINIVIREFYLDVSFFAFLGIYPVTVRLLVESA